MYYTSIPFQDETIDNATKHIFRDDVARCPDWCDHRMCSFFVYLSQLLVVSYRTGRLEITKPNNMREMKRVSSF